MRITAGILWIWILAYVINTEVTGAEIPLIGRYECPTHSQPWQAALFWENEFKCGGVLVHPQWVLAAAHCYNSSDIIGLGLHRLNQTQEPGSQMIKPNISVLYPQYNTSNKYVHDLMLIKLSEPAVISGTVKPIRMSSECPDFGTSCLLSGWVALSQGSHPDILECVDTVVFSPGILREVYTFTRFYKMFFAYSDRYNGSFYREYGGPLVCNGELQGIHVAGSLHNLYKLDLHINICRYKNWIEKIMKTY